MTPRTAIAALTLTAATVLSACGAADDGAAAAVSQTGSSQAGSSQAGSSQSSLEFRSVAIAAPGADATGDLRKDGDDLDTALADLGLGDSAGVDEAAAWFSAGDCAAEPVSTDEAAAGCLTDGSEVLVMGALALDGSHVTSAELVEDASGGDAVNLMLDDDGAAALTDLTETVLALPAPSNRIAIVLDGTVISAPTVRDVITGNEMQLVGSPGSDDMRALADAVG